LSFRSLLWHNKSVVGHRHQEGEIAMSVRERLSAVEQYVAYVIGLGIALAIIAMLLTGFGSVSSTSTTGMLLVGLALVVIGVAAWLYLARPWTKFDDLTTPYYTGHEEHAEPQAELPAATLSAGVPAPPAEPETAVEAALGDAIPAAPPVESVAEVVGVREEEVPAPPLAPEAAAVAPEEAAPAAPAEPAASAAPTPIAGTVARDNLLIIEGLGPKSQQVLYAAGIFTFQAVASSTPDALNHILHTAGLRLVNADTWPEQAARIIADRSET